MVFVDIAIASVIVLLAVLSRKNYSKYKDKNIMCPIYAIADMIFVILDSFFDSNKNMDNWRQLYVVSDDKLRILRKMHFVSGIVYCICVIIAFAFFGTLFSIGAGKLHEDNESIARNGYSGEPDTIKMKLYYGDESEDYELKVMPKEYTYDEFLQLSEDMFEELSKEILGENSSYDNITHNLQLVYTDKSGIFNIIWQSKEPTVISSSGRLWDDAAKGTSVCLEATIEYLDYSVKHCYELVVGDRKASDNPIIEQVKEKLVEMESRSRTEDNLVLPEEIDGVSIIQEKEKTNIFAKMMSLSVLMCIVIICLRQIKNKNMRKCRDNMLILKYPVFVNRMCLLLGTGMTMRNCLAQYIRDDNEEDYLNKEINYSLHRIAAGMEEASAYEELGRKLKLPSYARLFNHISQNTLMGTQNIRELMEEELQQSLEIRKENARKKGEEAFTRLLFPMIVLLIMVMLIIILPTMLIM